MSTSRLGETGIELSRIGFGTWGLGGVYYGEVKNEQGVRAVRSYIDEGGNHIDSAYAYHQAEDIVGEAIKHYDRSNLVLTSKTYAGSFNVDDVPRVRRELEVTLRALGTDYVDVYMIHGSPPERDRMDALLDMFETLRSEGKLRAIGCSIRGPMVTDDSVAIARQYVQTGRVNVLQMNYSIVRQKMSQMFAEANEHGVAIIARWVLESGMLGGNYRPGHEFVWPDTRNRYRPNERDAMLEAAQWINRNLPPGYRSAAEVAVGFALHNPSVSGIVLGATSAKRVAENCKLDMLPPMPAEYVTLLTNRYGPLNDEFNPTGEFEHVPSPRGAEA